MNQQNQYAVSPSNNISGISQSHTSKSSSRLHTNQNQTLNYYETLLACTQNKSMTKIAKPSNFSHEKTIIQTLQQQIVELKQQVQKLEKENQQLKVMQDQQFEVKHQYTQKIRTQYLQMTKYNNLIKKIHQLKLDNVQLKQECISIKRDFAIQFSPLKQIINYLLNQPKDELLFIAQLNQQNLSKEASMLRNQAVLLSEQRGEQQSKCFELEETIAQILKEKKQLEIKLNL